MRKQWTTGEEHVLKALREDGASVTSCAEVLGRTKASVSNRLKLMEIIIKPSDWTGEELLLLREFYPLVGSSICKVIGRSRRSVCKKAWMMGWSFGA